jgi:hypothetical protein
MIVCFLGYLLAVSVFFTTFVHKIYVVLKMEKVYAHREFGLEANIIGCATYEILCCAQHNNSSNIKYFGQSQLIPVL